MLLGLAAFSGVPNAVVGTLLVLIWPLALIWWGETIGSITGIHWGRINRSSPGWLVRGFGWVFLVLVVVWFAPDFLELV
ncbi:MAG: hypothetical protein ACYS0G_08190 [Planctomycetota bacterium]